MKTTQHHTSKKEQAISMAVMGLFFVVSAVSSVTGFIYDLCQFQKRKADK